MSTITLPDADEMMTRLKSVIDEPHAIEHLYPRITKYAGETRTLDGLELMILLAIEDYAGSMPPVMAGLHVAVPDFVAALSEGQVSE